MTSKRGAAGATTSEEDLIRERYARRSPDDGRYSWFSPGHLFLVHERERRVLRLLQRSGCVPIAGKKVLEVGCGTGAWLRDFLKWGARPENLVGLDLLGSRLAAARHLSPPSLSLVCGSGAVLGFRSNTFDIVLQSTVFTSILAGSVRRRVAEEMVRVLKPGGLILWYDFHVDNPGNPDVVGIPRREIVQLFSGCQIQLHRVTLAPPIARRLAPHSWLACQLLEHIPWMCTHYLGIFRKT